MERTISVGSLSLQPIRDGSGHARGSEILTRPGVDDPWSCHADQLDDAGHVSFAMGGFLYRTGDRVMLIDAGAGPLERDGLVGGALIDGLNEVGVRSEDITDVVFTHLHYDHVGWAATKGSVVFPNATYRAHRADWEFFVESPDASPGGVRKLRPIESQLELFDDEHTVAPHLTARPAPGHTPGSTVYILSDGTARALLLGDIVHSPVELAEPDWEALYDVDVAAASAMRNRIAQEVLDTDDVVIPAHFPGFAHGRVLTTDVGRRFVAS